MYRCWGRIMLKNNAICLPKVKSLHMRLTIFQSALLEDCIKFSLLPVSEEGKEFIYRIFPKCSIVKIRLFKYIKNSPPKTENFQIKTSDIFRISAQNIDYRYSLEPPQRAGSYEYPQSMFWAEIRKIMYTPVNPSFYYINVGFKCMFSWWDT